ncbi:hypothetical protein [Fibrobacter sp. UWH4]|uniref:hypothetical protein n=1 Tax=Fibrobacter sp. UWH4 TaxID=1896210 RepID=UPI00091B8DE2|nr:hypothetical protein [Fibrobacter sp. UWH4]SHK82312.1 hypothetical protein SAMN05720762_103143 [Fibrobacter sp. UWH4]
MAIYSEPFDKKILLELQTHYFGDMVKGVVDVAEGNKVFLMRIMLLMTQPWFHSVL